MKRVLRTGRDAPTDESRGTLVGTLAMVAGAAFVVGTLLTIAAEWGWSLVVIGMALLLYVVPQLHRFQSPADGWLGRAGSPLVLAGAGLFVAPGVIFLIWSTVGEPAGAGLLWMIGFRTIGLIALILGTVLFGIGSAMARRFPPAAPLLMLVGLLGALAIDMATGAWVDDERTTEWGFYIGVPLFGLGLAWMGYVLRSEARARPALGA